MTAKRAKLKRKKLNGLAAEPAAERYMADMAEPSKQTKKQKPSKQVPESSTPPLTGAVAALTAPETAPAKEKKGIKGSGDAGAQPASVPEPAAAVADSGDKKVKKKRRNMVEGDSDAAPALVAVAAESVPELKLKKKKQKVCCQIMLATVSRLC